MEPTLHGTAPFLWSQQQPELAQKVGQGEIVAQFWSGRGPVKVPSGLIHDWIAVAFIPDSTIQAVFGVIQNYDNHKNIYKPEVIDSKLIRCEGNDFQIYLRLLKRRSSPWSSILTMRCIIVQWTLAAGRGARTRRELQKSKTLEALASGSCSLIPVTDSSGACTPIGDSRSVMRG